MFRFERASDEIRYATLIDIGSGSVAISLTESDSKSKDPRILFSERESMRITKRGGTGTELKRKMKEALLAAVLDFSHEALGLLAEKNPKARISKVLLTCGAPWSTTISRNIEYKSEQEFKITESLIRDLTSSAEKEIEDQLLASNQIDVLDYEVVERTTVEVKLNDYEVQDPVGQLATQISLSHITGLIPKDILDIVTEVISKVLPHTPIEAHTSLLAQYCVMRDLFPHTDSYTIVDVTGEATEFGVVEHGILSESVATLYGNNTIIRGFLKNTNLSCADIQTMLSGYADKKIHPHIARDIDIHVKELQANLSETVQELLDRQRKLSTLYVIAPEEGRALFGNMIKEIITNEIRNSIRCHLITPELLTTENGGAHADVYSLILARFFHKLHTCGGLSE